MLRRLHMDRSRLTTAAIATVGLAAIVYGVSISRTGDQSVRPPAGVDRFVPQPGDLVLRQAQVGIDLAAGYRGELVIDGQTVPVYDMRTHDCMINTIAFAGKDSVFDPGQNTLYFTPSPGATIERFAPGEHRIVARFWKLCEDPSTAQQTSWTFKVS